MIFGKIIIILLLGYAVWAFITVACMGGIQGYRGYRRDCARIQKQHGFSKENRKQRRHNTFHKVFG